ncbi:MBOAT family protein [Candidatus Peregrinibacteria bacterium]|nr:MBOAT family protein [Candidatus Peregrinibacteria bacterium]MBI3816527.1 MBOAT family protein [Candidatus Peregrinibacteria bacterium]
MLFHSEIFLLWFLPITLGLYSLCPIGWRNVLLLIASYVFYAWWDMPSLLLMIAATVANYIAGALLCRESSKRRRHLLLTAAIAFDLAILCFFKYERMLSGTANILAGRTVLPVLNIVLPIGISFYLFEGMSYCIDCARGGPQSRSFTDFACYLSLFPHVLAGPIIRFDQLAGQLSSREHSFEKAAEGAYRFLVGLIKKVLIADAMAAIADPVFHTGPSSFLHAWIGLIAYTLQIYGDFSGYSDMAIGLGLLFGLRFPENFSTPYLSRSIGEFWRRWHSTLSSWFRDYVYIGLGGNRNGTAATLRNLFITMLLVLHPLSLIGYRLGNTLRAFSFVNFQWILQSFLFRFRSHAATFRSRNSTEETRPLMHCLLRTPISISAIFSQLACLGV